MSLSEKETRVNLIDPAIEAVGWTAEMIRKEETAGRIAIIRGRTVRSRVGRTDYTLRVKIAKDAQPVAMGVLEANQFKQWLNEHLIPQLKELKNQPRATARQKVVSEILSGVERVRIDTDRNLLDVLDKIDGTRLRKSPGANNLGSVPAN